MAEASASASELASELGQIRMSMRPPASCSASPVSAAGSPGSPKPPSATPNVPPSPAGPAKWGVWVGLPGLGPSGAVAPGAAPHLPRDGESHLVHSNSPHCCITVDLDLTAGVAKFFRNGHLIGHGFSGLSAPVVPTLAFLQARARAQRCLAMHSRIV